MNTEIQQGIKIAVISDLHVMAPQLLVKGGSAFEEYLQRDRKMLVESLSILDTLISDILSQKPHLTIVTGDLTKDGERLSHELVATQLQRLVDAGIQVLVVPGNHDPCWDFISLSDLVTGDLVGHLFILSVFHLPNIC